MNVGINEDFVKIVTPAKAGVQKFLLIQDTGFRLESIPHLMRDRNDLMLISASFYEFPINEWGSFYYLYYL